MLDRLGSAGSGQVGESPTLDKIRDFFLCSREMLWTDEVLYERYLASTIGTAIGLAAMTHS